jgi:membrane-bound serine protease (ClpP class)
MKARQLIVALITGLAIASPGTQAVAKSPSAPVVQTIDLDLTVNPASADWVNDSLDDAKKDGVDIVIFRLDTPGGLDESMREMVKDIIAAPMPVVVYVAPDGARAASAGLFVTEAADVAAMAPQTNIGSATPINIGGGDQDKVLGRKVRNDAAAYVQALAESHGRNPELAEQMVRRATNVTAAEAKQRDLIDIIASSDQDLVEKLDGFRVKGPKHQVLETTDARIEHRDVPFKFQVLELIVNPTTAYLLFTLALFGIGFELFHPGAILPGAIGGISLILALFGFAQLPINIAGVLLILLAFGLLIAEAFIVSHGALAAGGIVALVFGGLLLFDTNSDAYEVSVPVVIFTGALFGGFFVFVISKAVETRHRRVYTGSEELIGERAVVRSRLDPVGHVFVRGALWRATGLDSASFEVGDEVLVEKVDGLTLTVRKPETGL